MRLNIFEMYKDGKFVGKFDKNEISKKIGIEPSEVYQYAKRELIFNGDYTFVKTDEFTNVKRENKPRKKKKGSLESCMKSLNKTGMSYAEMQMQETIKMIGKVGAK